MAINMLDSIKLSSVEATEFAPLPEGVYDTVIADVRIGTTGPQSKNPGDPQLSVTFKVTEDGEFKNRRLFAYYTLVEDSETHKGMAFTKRFLKGTGFDVDSDPTVAGILAHYKLMIAEKTPVECMVEQQDWNGGISNRVTEVRI